MWLWGEEGLCDSRKYVGVGYVALGVGWDSGGLCFEYTCNTSILSISKGSLLIFADIIR